jgi:hypothetical protein
MHGKASVHASSANSGTCVFAKKKIHLISEHPGPTKAA